MANVRVWCTVTKDKVGTVRLGTVRLSTDETGTAFDPESEEECFSMEMYMRRVLGAQGVIRWVGIEPCCSFQPCKSVSAAWVLSELAGMSFPEQGQAYDYMKKRMERIP